MPNPSTHIPPVPRFLGSRVALAVVLLPRHKMASHGDPFSAPESKFSRVRRRWVSFRPQLVGRMGVIEIVRRSAVPFIFCSTRSSRRILCEIGTLISAVDSTGVKSGGAVPDRVRGGRWRG